MELHLHEDIETKIEEYLEDTKDSEILNCFLLDIVKKRKRIKEDLISSIESLVEEELKNEI